jgi:hypothetical protein
VRAIRAVAFVLVLCAVAGGTTPYVCQQDASRSCADTGHGAIRAQVTDAGARYALKSRSNREQPTTLRAVVASRIAVTAPQVASLLFEPAGDRRTTPVFDALRGRSPPRSFSLNS